MIKKNDTQYQFLRNKLLQQIQQSEANARIAPERKLAEKFGVCRATVNRVLMNLMEEGYIVRYSGRGTFVSPRDRKILQTNDNATRTSGNVILAYPDVFSYTLWSEFHTLEMLALKNNLQSIHMKLQPYSDFTGLIDLAKSTPDLCGIIVEPPKDGFPKGILQQLDQLNVKVIVLEDLAEVSIYRNIYELHFDHFKSGYLRMNSLLAAGHRNLAFIPNEAFQTLNTPSVLGMRKALQEYDMCWRDVVKPDLNAENWATNVKRSYQQTMEVLKAHPETTALVVDTIHGCFGVLRALYELKLKCPDDVSIVTSMSLMSLEEVTCPALTSVEANFEDECTQVFELLLKESRIKRVLVDQHLIERESIRKILPR